MTFIGSTSLGCTGAEKQKSRRRIKCTSICCLRADRANSMRSKALRHCPAAAFVAVVRWSMGGYRRPTGVMRLPGKDRMSLVLVPRGEGLAIAHGANVPIDEEAEATIRSSVSSTPASIGDFVQFLPVPRKRARRLRRAKFREEERSTVGTQFRTSDDSALLAKVNWGIVSNSRRLCHLSIVVDPGRIKCLRAAKRPGQTKREGS